MARVTEAEVLKIWNDSDPLPTGSMGVFILGANLIVTNNLGSSTLSTATLKEIERWLSAHMASARTRQEDSIKISSAGAKFTGKYGMGLKNTQYGQMVEVLDSTGILVALGRPNAQFAVISKDELP